MPVNLDKPERWKADVAASVDQFNEWFLDFAPKTFRDTRITSTDFVRDSLIHLNDYLGLNEDLLLGHPAVLSVLRMSTSPPIARDRLTGLAYSVAGVVDSLEQGKVPPRMSHTDLREHLQRIVGVIDRLLDRDIFPWLDEDRRPKDEERERAAMIVADRLCGSNANPLIRNAQEKRQLASIGTFLKNLGYREKAPPPLTTLKEMEPGTFTFRMNVVVGSDRKTNIPVDTIIQPIRPYANRLPLLIEAKSAGDFTNVNKRRKEEAQKFRQLRAQYGEEIQLVLFLCGYFDSGYLGYSASEGLDWVWEHRISDLLHFGL